MHAFCEAEFLVLYQITVMYPRTVSQYIAYALLASVIGNLIDIFQVRAVQRGNTGGTSSTSELVWHTDVLAACGGDSCAHMACAWCPHTMQACFTLYRPLYCLT